MYLAPISIVLDELHSDEFAVALCADWASPDGIEPSEAPEHFFSAVQAAFAEWFVISPLGREIWDEMGCDFCFADLHPEDIEDESLIGLLAKHEIHNFVIQEAPFANVLEESQDFMERVA